MSSETAAPRRFAGKRALVTGAARGQGRSHAVALASEGADVIALDVCAPIPTVAYELATPADLTETARLVEQAGGRVVTAQVDVRDGDAVRAAVLAGAAELGGLDIVLANAGIGLSERTADPQQVFRTQLEINLIGVWNTVQAAAPLLIEQGRGGAIVLTSSVFGLTGRGGDGSPGADGYVASKHGVIGLMRTWANWLAPHGIRVNCVTPSGVATPMILNPAVEALFGGAAGGAAPKPVSDVANLLDVELLDPADVTAAVTWLASDEARYVTGTALPVDAGFLVR